MNNYLRILIKKQIIIQQISKRGTMGFRQNIIRGVVPKKEEFIEECLHKRESEWDLVAVGDSVK